MTTIGIVLFEGMEELDFAGPWEVFASAAALDDTLRVTTIAERDAPLRCAKGLRVLADTTMDAAPSLDVIVVPGGDGRRRETGNPKMIGWLRDASARATWVTSVCTGAFLLAEAGPARGRRVTTHWSRIDELRARGDVTVVEKTRYVRDGNVVTAAGVSAGIDMSLWLLGQLRSPSFARDVQRAIEYEPAPPYAAET